MSELYIGFFRKYVGNLKLRSFAEHEGIGRLVAKNDGMGISHADSRDDIFFAADADRFRNHFLAVATSDRDMFGRKNRLAHIYSHFFHLSILHVEAKAFYAGMGLEGNLAFVGQTALIDIAADASARVAAHLRLGAVGVKHPHSEISFW